MSEQLNVLIAEARKWATKPDEYIEDDLLVRLADALELTADHLREAEDALECIAGAVDGWTWLPERGDVLTYVNLYRQYASIERNGNPA